MSSIENMDKLDCEEDKSEVEARSALFAKLEVDGENGSEEGGWNTGSGLVLVEGKFWGDELSLSPGSGIITKSSTDDDGVALGLEGCGSTERAWEVFPNVDVEGPKRLDCEVTVS